VVSTLTTPGLTSEFD